MRMLTVMAEVDVYDVLDQIDTAELAEYLDKYSDYVVTLEEEVTSEEENESLSDEELQYLINTVDESTIDGKNLREKLVRLRWG